MNSGFVILTVSQLNLYARSLLEADSKLSSVFVRGEISNFNDHYRSGHLYMSLKDAGAVIRAVMFRSSAQNLRFLPQDGMKVIATGRVSIYDRDGQYQLYIDDMQPDGVGALHVAFEQLRRKLAAEGLFDETRKRPLPPFPTRIGVVTSPTGAVLHDILTILGRRWPLAEVVFYPVSVQGDAAPEQIIRGIRYFSDSDAADVLIVGRGGGSMEDIWSFNDEGVARAVADCAIPVISAVGHETDFTICDFAADLRAPTPSAAAELVSPDAQEVRDLLFSCQKSMYEAVHKSISQKRARYESSISSKALSNPLHSVELRRMKLDMLTERAANAQKYRFAAATGRFSTLAGKLDTLSPLKVLSRGYAIPTDSSDTVIMSVEALQPGKTFSLKLSDGSVDCRVLSDTTGLKKEENRIGK